MEIQAKELHPNLKAFLKVIQHSEGTDKYSNPYLVRFGGSLFTSFADHPRTVIEKSGYKSSAAGAYQILAKTYDSLNLHDFSPSSQDRAAVTLITRRGALQDVLQGKFETAIAKCNKEWASFPGSPYGQPTATLANLKAVFLKAAGVAKKFSPLIFFICGAIFLFSVLKSKMYV